MLTIMEKKRNSFSSSFGFVLAAAGSAIGLGNIWRFPYLAAEYGGGIFLVIYIILAMTFGYTMIVAETAIGRMSQKSPVGAFGYFSKKPWAAAGGWINAIIPILIVPYYSVIGGWVVRYFIEYITGHVHDLAGDDAFTAMITSGLTSEIWFLIFTILSLTIIFMGVQGGIERVSRLMMPVLVVLAAIVCIYSMTRPGAGAGIRYFLIPNVKHFSWMTVVSAMGQMFYSLSIAMGILITFGSYMKKDVSIEGATRQVEFFDTLIAVMAGLMIIPAVFAFSGDKAAENLQAGPSLMFITMPKIFHAEDLRFHGIWECHRCCFFPSGSVRCPDQCHCAGRKCRFYLRGSAGLVPEKSNPDYRRCHDFSWLSFCPWVWPAFRYKGFWHEFSGFL